MYEKRNHNLPTDQNLSHAVRQAIDYEQRIAFVESICAELNDDLFDPAREYRLVTDLRFGPGRGPAFFNNDLTIDGPVTCYEVFTDPESARHMADAVRRELAQAGLVSVATRRQPLSPSTLGRGSPCQ